MPFDLFGQWIDDPTRAPNDQMQGQAQQAFGGLTQAAAFGQMQAQQNLAIGMQMQGAANNQNLYAGDPWGQAAYYGQDGAYAGVRGRPIDYIDLLNQFAVALDGGITEITVNERLYAYLWAYIGGRAYRPDEPPTGMTNLTITTAMGYITIKPPGRTNPTGDDFDRYMECVECDKLP